MSALSFAAAVLAAWFLRAPAPPDPARWPDSMPVFAEGRADFACTGANGTAFVSARTSDVPEAALRSVREAFIASGWKELPVHPRDMALFQKGDAIASVLAQGLEEGSRLTAIVRPRY